MKRIFVHMSVAHTIHAAGGGVFKCAHACA